MVKLLSGIAITTFLFGAGALWWRTEERIAVVSPTVVPSTPSQSPFFTPTVTPEPLPTPLHMMLYEVPFTAQAPTANWTDPLYQNACEEASILMAGRYLSGAGITSQQALSEIRVLADRANTLFGSHLDESARDTAALARDVLTNASVDLIEDATPEDIISALASGKVVLVPLNGQMLKNPHYKSPGPVRHMLVVKGYDSATKEFITNDPGTRQGNGYRYMQQLLVSAMHDWDTGDNTQIYPDRKVIIAIGKEES